MTKRPGGSIRIPPLGAGSCPKPQHTGSVFRALPEDLRACAHRLFADIRQDPDLAHVSDDQLMRVICSQAIRPLLAVHARHCAAGGRPRPGG